MKCLFIGGRAAGRIIDVEDFVSNIQIPIPEPEGFGADVYRRGHIRNSSGENVCVFHRNGEDPIEILMSSYAKARKQ